jgi:predicted metal-dependent peptidase
MSDRISAKAKDLMSRARSKLIIEEPFYGNLSMRLELVETARVPAMAVDGRYQFYNPGWVTEQSVGKLAFVLAHEVSHLTLHHHTRREGRDYKFWNIACDYCVNAELRAGRWEVPDDALYSPVFEGMSAEQVYASLLNEQEQQAKRRRQEQQQGQQGQGSQGQGQQGQQGQEGQQGQQGQQSAPEQGQGQQSPDSQQGKGQPGTALGCERPSEESTNGGSNAGGPQANPAQQGTEQGGSGQAADPRIPISEMGLVMEPMNEEDRETSAQAWDQAVVSAARQAQKAGHLPGNIARKVKEILHPPRPWKEELRQYFRSTAIDEPNYSRVNRRYVDQGMYLPSMRSEALDSLVIAIDTSGSINQEALSSFVQEMEDILREVQCEQIHMIACDVTVKGDVVTSYDQEMPKDFKLEGGGGTRFSPVFQKIEDEALNPNLLIYFTDLKCSEVRRKSVVKQLQEPDYDVVWVKWGTGGSTPPFGQVIDLD